MSCKTRLSDTQPDALNAYQNPADKKESVINLPIEIPLPALEEEINRQFEGLIYEDVSYDKPDKDDVMVRIWKAGTIKLQAYNEFLKYDVPIRIWASYRWRACDACPAIEKSTDFNINVAFTSKLMVNPDFTFNTQTFPSGFNFVTKPKLDFGVVKIPITAIVEPIVKEQLADVGSEIDTEIAASFNFSKEIDSVWRTLHEPQLIDSIYKAWLKITPSDIFLSPIRGNSERIRITLGFKGLFEFIIGQKPPVLKTNPLPVLKTSEKTEQDFSFFIESFIDFETATELARMHVKDSIMELAAGKKVKIDDIEFLGLNDKVFTRVDLSQSINGSVYFMGTPAYDSVQKTIYFNDFDFDIKSKNALIKTAKWLLHGTLKNIIEKQFNYSIADDLTSARNSITALLKGYDFDKIFTLKGKLEKLDIYDIITEPQGLRIIINCTGKAQMKFNSLAF